MGSLTLGDEGILEGLRHDEAGLEA